MIQRNEQKKAESSDIVGVLYCFHLVLCALQNRMNMNCIDKMILRVLEPVLYIVTVNMFIFYLHLACSLV